MDINITLFGQMITFIIFVVFTMKFVWPPIKNAMEERKEKIIAGLAASDKAINELKKAGKKRDELINQAKIQASKILDMAHGRAVEINQEAKKHAIIDVNRIRQAADNEIHLKISKMKEELKNEIGDVIIFAAEKLLSKNIKIKMNQKLLEDVMSKL